MYVYMYNMYYNIRLQTMRYNTLTLNVFIIAVCAYT